MNVEIIIIGQGLAGSLLALTLLKEGFEVVVIAENETHLSSRVAAGIVNPITGKRVVKTWLADQLFSILPGFYAELETLLEASFFYPKSIYKPFESVSEQNDCLSKSGPDDYAQYMNITPDHEAYSKFIQNPLGGFEIKEGGYLDTNTFLDATILYLQKNKRLFNQKVNVEDIILTENGVSIGAIHASKLIFCEGHQATLNTYFNWLPFAPAKGEVLTIESDAIVTENMISRGVFILPIGNKKFRVGATYAWTFEDANPTQKALEDLKEKLNEVVTVPYTVSEHKAGIRPATKYRRPFLGQHPVHHQLGIFNGFGSKGVSLIPFFARQYAAFLKNRAELLPEVNIEQYLSLYLKTKNPLEPST